MTGLRPSTGGAGECGRALRLTNMTTWDARGNYQLPQQGAVPRTNTSRSSFLAPRQTPARLQAAIHEIRHQPPGVSFLKNLKPSFMGVFFFLDAQAYLPLYPLPPKRVRGNWIDLGRGWWEGTRSCLNQPTLLPPAPIPITYFKQ